MADPLSITAISLNCRNFKCFSDKSAGFDRIKPINLIIGRNNSGKTTLLDLVEHATCQLEDIDNRGHKGRAPEAFVSWQLTKELIERLPEKKRSSLGGFSARDMATRYWFNQEVTGTIPKQGKTFSSVEATPLHALDPPEQEQLNIVKRSICSSCPNPLHGVYTFRRIAADRDITPEVRTDPLNIQANGSGVTNAIVRYLIDVSLNRDFAVEDLLLDGLNNILPGVSLRLKLLGR